MLCHLVYNSHILTNFKNATLGKQLYFTREKEGRAIILIVYFKECPFVSNRWLNLSNEIEFNVLNCKRFELGVNSIKCDKMISMNDSLFL